ncbi:MAG TPA: hypothetical protein VHB98_23610, partial [Chloroflexota bacterium]|nr:hypothetical protein [Chloroflexota bacterium]
NIVLKGSSQEQVVTYLEQHKQRAFVSPTRNELTFVYATDDAWNPLAEALSRTYGCAALFESVYDSDIFQYMLYEQGNLIDQYNSAPDYWDGEEWADPESDEEVQDHQPEPVGGDARVLCAAFGAEQTIEVVDAILHPPVEGSIRHAAFDAFHQHWTLAEALGWPPSASVEDFRGLESNGVDELVDDFGGGTVIKTS